jgi:hypothetical protein
MQRTLGLRKPVFHLPPRLVLLATALMGRALGDVILTPQEVTGLRQNLLISPQPPHRPTKLSEWLEQNRTWLGTRYMSEVKRHYR